MRYDMDVHPPFKGDTEAFFRKLKENEITKCCGEVRCEDIEAANAFAYSLKSDMYTPALLLDGTQKELSLAQLELYGPKGIRIAAGLRRQDTELLTACRDKGFIVKSADADICADYPDMKVILDCSILAPLQLQPLMEKYENLYVLTRMLAYNYYLHSAGELCSCKRILFGSGYPDFSLAYQIAAVEWELRDNWEAGRILYANYERLMR